MFRYWTLFFFKLFNIFFWIVNNGFHFIIADDSQDECLKCGKTYTISDKQQFTGRCPGCSRDQAFPTNFSISRLTESTPKCYNKNISNISSNDFTIASLASPHFDRSPPFSSAQFFTTPPHVKGALSPISTLSPMFTGMLPGLTSVSSRPSDKLKLYGQFVVDERIINNDHSQVRQLWPGVPTHGYWN